MSAAHGSYLHMCGTQSLSGGVCSTENSTPWLNSDALHGMRRKGPRLLVQIEPETQILEQPTQGQR